MKLIVAIIQPTRLEAVKAALTEVEVFRLTVMDVQGFGRQKGHHEVYRGHEIAVNLLRKVNSRSRSTRNSSSRRSMPSSKVAVAARAAKSAMAKTSSCRSTIAFASGPANVARKRSNQH